MDADTPMTPVDPIVAYLADVRAFVPDAHPAASPTHGAGAPEPWVAKRLELDELRERFEALDAPDLARLATWRLLASNTLRGANPGEAARWDAANAFLAGVIARGDFVGAALAGRLNRVLTIDADEGGLPSPLRDYDLYGGDGRYLSPCHVARELVALDTRLAAPRGDALLEAFVTYTSVVTIHPFEGGNGRTARLMADAILLGSGWLPLCFPSPVRSHVALLEGGSARTIEGAYATFLEGVSYAYECALGAKG